jgi:hypothetical protein
MRESEEEVVEFFFMFWRYFEVENCTHITNYKNIKKVYSNTKEDLLPILGDYSSRSPILSSHTDLPILA